MSSARRVPPASGRPPAMPLAVVTMSGTTPSWSQANQSPVRQNPVWISSATNTIPCWPQNSPSPGRNPPARPAQRVSHRHPVDLARERPELVLVRHVLGGQRHCQVGAPVVAVVERDDRLAPGGVPSDLHRVL